MRPICLTLVASLCGLVSLVGCGAGRERPGDRIAGRTITIYSSAPLHGASSVDAQAAANGERLALSENGSRIGRYHVVFEQLDDSTVQSGGWDPGQTSLNARLAVRDPTTIGYLGEFNSGASAISMPVLNVAGISQISPGSTAVGLTSAAAGSAPGEPQKYYPLGVRTFARVVPNDAIQAAAQVRLQQSVGCGKTFSLEDGTVDGQATAITFVLAAQSAGLQVVGLQAFQHAATDYDPLALSVAQAGADCVLISAISEQDAVRVTEAIAKALPAARIFTTAQLADSAYADPARGGIPSSLDSRVLMTAPALDAGAYPPSARAFFASYAREFGAPQPYAIFGYEAMSLMLGAIARATDKGRKPALRSTVAAAILSTRRRRSVLGSYRIERNGDTTIRRYGVYRVVAGRLAFWEAIDV